MQVSTPIEKLPIRNESDVVIVRQVVRKRAMDLKFSLVEQTKVVTAASELARNTLIHGGGGEASMESVQDGANVGLRMQFRDQGPGIVDVALALKDGYTSGGGLGMGLGGSKRLVNDFKIDTTPGQGTCITAVKWKGR